MTVVLHFLHSSAMCFPFVHSEERHYSDFMHCESAAEILLCLWLLSISRLSLDVYLQQPSPMLCHIKLVIFFVLSL